MKSIPFLYNFIQIIHIFVSSSFIIHSQIQTLFYNKDYSIKDITKHQTLIYLIMERHYDSFAGRKDAYSSPRIEVLEISVEKGFVDS